MKSLVLLFTAAAAAAQTPCNLSAYKEQPGLKAYQANGRLEVAWSGERGDQLMAAFAIDRGAPVVRELAVKSKDGRSTTLAFLKILAASAAMGVAAHLTIVWIEHVMPGTSVLLKAVRVFAAIAAGVAVLIATAHLLRIEEFGEALRRVLRRVMPARAPGQP